MKGTCRLLRLAASLMLLAGGLHAGLVFNITDNLTDATFGTGVGVVDGVVQAAANFWVNNIGTHPGFVRDLSGNATFNLTFSEANIDGTGANPADTTDVPANTKNPAALPNAFVFNIRVNTAAAATAAMFWDPTPATTLDEFDATATPGRFTAKAAGPANNNFDMFTVLEHEIGHVLAYNDYTDFQNFVNNYWNPAAGTTKINLTSDHFIGGTNLMSNAAALPAGKSGRVFAQPEDWLPTPEPATWLISVAGLGIFVLRKRA
ncbi:MAG TPA: PEP-CTERM sorting domain-containing protein [Candidatus Solibacter sp.]|nr:PEP-CTERM sorting domain-containing protein [Candidatus Solibacter sp.]